MKFKIFRTWGKLVAGSVVDGLLSPCCTVMVAFDSDSCDFRFYYQEFEIYDPNKLDTEKDNQLDLDLDKMGYI